jgi:anti-anti-sigma factor
MEMEVSEIDGNRTRVRLVGRLDAPGAERIGVSFTAAVAAAGRDALVDLSEVSFIASMGLRLLIGTARALAGKGASMVLFGAQDLVREMLDQAGIDQIIPIVETEQQALERL